MEKRPVQKRKKATKIATTEPLRKQFNPEYKCSPGEQNNQPSLTNPDMSLTVLQLLQNHTRGIGSNIQQNEGQYFDTEIPIFDDITDEVAYKEELKQRDRELMATAKSEKEQKQAEILEAQKTAIKEAENQKQSEQSEEKL